MPLMSERARFGLLLIASLLLALIYASVTPYRTAGVLFSVPGPDGKPLRVGDVGAPDENRHANYVGYLLRERSFPVLRAGSPDFDETYQSHQPPLYYVLAAGWSSLVGAQPAESSGSRIRWLNALIGLLAVGGVYAAARWGVGREDVALGAAAIAGMLPMVAALNGAISNDPLLYAGCAWTFALCALALREGWTRRVIVGLGVVLGLSWLTKTSALALGPLVVTALIVTRAGWKAWLVPLALGGAIVLPWWLRNVSVYGEPLGMRAFNVAFAGQANAQALIERMGPGTYWVDGVATLTGMSFLGVFGYMDIPMPDALYRLFAAVTVVLAIGWAMAAFGPRRSEDDEWGDRRMIVLGAVMILVVIAFFVQFNLTYFQAQARYLFPALAPIAIGLAMGASRLLGPRWGWVAIVALLVIANAVAIVTLTAQFPTRIA